MQQLVRAEEPYNTSVTVIECIFTHPASARRRPSEAMASTSCTASPQPRAETYPSTTFVHRIVQREERCADTAACPQLRKDRERAPRGLSRD